LSILNWLTKNGSRDISNLVHDADIYIPVDSGSSVDLQLDNARNVVYSDSDFLKEFTRSEPGSTLLFSDSSIHQKLAECLGLRLLSEKLDISKDAFEDTGQHEPLMQRLKTILKSFKDDLTIIKELLQNADDAEATEFNICYDNRFHDTKKERLLFQGMSQVHGPALVIHNNKTFSNEDFINITKLSGATKEKKQLKIGKFGEGFCSVYHMTDVPSFASRDYLHIFDPTLTCLNKEVKNPQKPGKKIKFTEKIISQSDQLNPYVGLFGFRKTASYKGTLFRLPFRTCASELSSKCYNEETIIELMCEMRKCASSLLLFLQHVEHVTFWRVDHGESEPMVLFEITKSLVSSMEFIPKHARLLSIALHIPTELSADTSEHWLVAKKVQTINSERATASVACSLRFVNSMYNVMRDLKGEIFCFLPLSLRTGLPVHISGNFAVMNNRQGIWSPNEKRGKTAFEVEWNVSIMQDVIPKAYILLLVTLKRMHTRNLIKDYLFYELWPLQSNLTIPFELLPPLYKQMIQLPLLLSADSNWLCLSESKILKPGVLSLQSDIETPECVLEILTHLDIPLVYVPSKYYQCLSLQLGNEALITEDKFISLFFQKLGDFEGIRDARNGVLLILLKIYAEECVSNTDRSIFLHEFLISNPCIPTSPDGAVLRRCEDLIHPNSQFASLYDKIDHCFPDEKLAEQQFSNTAFFKLGMIRDDVPWSMLIERAQTIPIVLKENKVRALKQVKTILKCIDLKSSEPNPMISEITFLPVVPKPDNYHLSWKGEGTELSSGSKLLLARKGNVRYDSSDNTIIAGSQVMFVCEHPPEKGGCGSISLDTIQKLHIQSYPTSSSVINQLKEVIRLSVFSTESPQWIEEMCTHIYSFLDKEVHHVYDREKEIPGLSELKKLPCIWNGTKFIYTQQVAKMNGPYLFTVPPGLLAHKYLCEALQIKEEFSGEDVISALQEIKNKFGGEALDEEHKTIFKLLVPLLETVKPREDLKVLLPDENFILHKSDKLVYNDTKFAPREDKYVYVNDIISRPLAIQFNIKFVSSKVLDKYSVEETSHFAGIEFGQSEKLTVRVKNILHGYPFDVTVLKELLQNADDAKATKMYIILDKRFHGKESVFSEKWQKLQGPALLVWNNSMFSKADLKGIQKLGIGSKRGDFESIGQYGIGFNVVYHLTDCPSFVTGDNSLCIFDPHCHFIEGATQKAPGRMLSAEIWEKYPDIKVAYLQSSVVKDFCDIQRGSLFRFPLRHTIELVEMSEIVEHEEYRIVTAKKMHEILQSWVPQMKHAMIFLNHVMELKVFVIEDDVSILTEYHFKSEVSKADQMGRNQLHKNVSSFKAKQSKSYITHYPMTLELKLGREVVKENWMVQQGIGDINVQDREWKLVKRIKPKHGIAAPFNKISSPSCTQPEEKSTFMGRVFCFLPLPIESKLPVHINGSFVLNSTRLDLFNAPNTDEARWNKNLMKAIGSSYEKFLTNTKEFIFSELIYTSWPPLESRIFEYYSLFPNMRANLEHRWLSLAQDVYSKLVKYRAQIFIVTKADFIQLTSSAERSKVLRVFSYSCGTGSSTVYFCKEHDQKAIRPILEKLGMVITSAPLCLMDTLNEVHRKTKSFAEIPATSPQTVCNYYMENYSQCSRTGFPCAISESSFETVENFRQFTLYTLSEGKECTFAESPFGYPLLLTEDGQLRNFDESNKVVKSGFSGIFSQACQSKFLHCEMINVPYSSSYFATPVDREECLKVVLGIFFIHVPEVLRSQKRVNNNAGRIISKDAQKNLWKCLTEDETFKKFLFDILKEFAFIPSTSDELFSSSSPLKPVLASPHDFQQHAAEIEVLKSIGVPFIDDKIVCTEIESPHWNNSVELLETLFYLFQESDFTHLMNEFLAKTIIDLVKNNNFRIEKIRIFAASLPLYKTIDGKFTYLHKDVLQWPSYNMCEVAYHKWAQHFDATFLTPNATWTNLASPEDLRVKTISAEEIYMIYVFPHFSLFTDRERFIHLKHIRDHLYRPNKHHYDPSKLQVSTNFLNALNNLKCLMSDGTLRKVSEFCNHEEAIFRAFSHQFFVLPKVYREGEEVAKWIELFNDLGLRQTVSKEEYLKVCTEVSEGCHSHLSEASEVLVRCLFSSVVHNWQEDTDFLYQVSRISFVKVKVMESLNWIAKQANTDNIILSFMDGNTTIELTAPFRCALPGCSRLLWTVKPIVDFHLPQTQTQTILQGLMVTENACPADVITNVHNICANSSLADFSLFNAYPEALKPPEGVTGLMEVMLEIFQYLMQSSECDTSTLRSLPCVPVTSTPEANSKWQLVLVKPCFVLRCRVDDLHPYLHKLPDELLCVTPLMVKIGVKNCIELSHIQAVLSEAYSQTDGVKMEANTRTCVIEAIKHLKKILQDEQKKFEDVKDVLSPLYLPSSEGKLHLSTDMVYIDNRSAYSKGHVHLEMEHTQYAELQILPHSYGFTSYDLCNIIPQEIRPIKMSELCKEHAVYSCRVAETSVTSKIKITLKLSFISVAVLQIFSHYMKDEEIDAKLKVFVTEFLSNIEVFTVENLRTTIKLKKTGEPIGEGTVNFFLQNEDNSRCFLYLDSTINVPFNEKVIHHLSDYLLLELTKVHPNTASDVVKQIRDMLVLLFNAQNDSQVEEVLKTEGISIDNHVHDKEFPMPELGEEIPVCWHHRLDQDIDNIFYPTEWVGYEDQENHIIFVQVGYPKLPDEHADFDTIPRLRLEYMIHTRKDDLDGTAVSGLDLLKFIRGKAKLKATICQPTDDGDYEDIEFDEEHLESTKEKVLQELKNVWMLPVHLKKKAVRRLYLKWRNPDESTFSGKVFKFIMNEIKRLEEQSHLPQYEQGSSYRLSYDYPSWQGTAENLSYWRRQKHSYEKAQATFSPFGHMDSNKREGWRWVKQADVDYMMLVKISDLAQAEPDIRGYGLVCFLSHQVSEKALQGGVCAICGKDERKVTDHNLLRRAHMLQARKPGRTIGLISHVVILDQYYLSTRYPNYWEQCTDIPADHFTASQAKRAFDSAKFVHEMVRELMPVGNYL
jgi:sacsin